MSQARPPGYRTSLTQAAVVADEQRGEPDCPHDDVWEESGQCMACRPAIGARHDDGISDELAREQWGGR